MIRILQGQVHSYKNRCLILMTGGVGYRVFVSAQIENELNANAEKNNILLHIHTHIREDAFDLYGFIKEEELSLFEMLISVSGVGPKMALSILELSPAQIQKAILEENFEAFTQISGVGKKIAARLVLELKGKMKDLGLPDSRKNTDIISSSKIQDELMTTLEALGYKRAHIQSIMKNSDPEMKDTETLIRWFLQNV